MHRSTDVLLQPSRRVHHIPPKKGRGPNDMKQEACNGDESSPFLKTRYSAYQHRQVRQEDGREWLNGRSRRDLD
jgi:hypothetical protein